MVADQDGMHGIVTWIKHSYMCIYIYADNYCVAYLSGIPTNIAGSITLGLALPLQITGSGGGQTGVLSKVK